MSPATEREPCTDPRLADCMDTVPKDATGAVRFWMTRLDICDIGGYHICKKTSLGTGFIRCLESPIYPIVG